MKISKTQYNRRISTQPTHIDPSFVYVKVYPDTKEYEFKTYGDITVHAEILNGRDKGKLISVYWNPLIRA